jgi:hypothetical protein
MQRISVFQISCFLFAYYIILHVYLLITPVYYYIFHDTVLIHITFRCISLIYGTSES